MLRCRTSNRYKGLFPNIQDNCKKRDILHFDEIRQLDEIDFLKSHV